jgi:very-short-patch-repair endonuclease
VGRASSSTFAGAQISPSASARPVHCCFACIEHRLVIEANGGQHADSDDDARRTAWLESRGWRVLRFWNNDIPANPEDVQEAILQVIRTTSPEV